jgi:hypothetical protein
MRRQAASAVLLMGARKTMRSFSVLDMEFRGALIETGRTKVTPY